MDISHDRFDELAVAHVMGGLPPADAAEFRAHLVSCPDCRARVEELRGLASDLEAAEREERAAGHGASDGPPGVDVDRRRRWLFVLAAVMLVVVFLATVWNQALRFDNTTLVGATAVRERVLATLGDGEAMPVETRADVTGVAALDRDTGRLAISMGGVGEIADMYRVVVWLDEGTEAVPAWEDHMVLTPDQLVDERLAVVVPVTDRTRQLIVTVEQQVMPSSPNDFPVFRVPLR